MWDDLALEIQLWSMIQTYNSYKSLLSNHFIEHQARLLKMWFFTTGNIQTQTNTYPKEKTKMFLRLIWCTYFISSLLGGLPVTVDDVINRARKMISYQCLYLLLSSHRSVASQWKSSADSVYQWYQYRAQIYVLSE